MRLSSFFFFKQKTAYEMRISDWSSDVCSSDLHLVQAARNGKDVTVVVELRARFDEEANLGFADRLQEAGVQVVYGVVGYKTHAKMLLVVRREGRKLRRYVHLGTGNRSEEHTSELQSLMRISYAVFCLKKKNTNK